MRAGGHISMWQFHGHHHAYGLFLNLPSCKGGIHYGKLDDSPRVAAEQENTKKVTMY
jgi:hypothetical protein